MGKAGPIWAVTHLLEGSGGWESSTSHCAFMFFFLKGRGKSCGRTMNEIPSSSRLLQLHAVHHGEEGLLIETPLGLSGDLCILWLLLPFPGSRRAQSTELIICWPSPLGSNTLTALFLAFQTPSKGPRHQSNVWMTGRDRGKVGDIIYMA